ncbi:MAG: D-glycero-beta-D-manno-heptose 1,7-bisphosphate 7-phosphatase [Gammaproteobacteria bacterium]|nr:D-glycero-beta-D-manno-heptose 1,7-bisphosphate 7-phosphatase [Gammaproteobacteria bacterium]
MKLVILDRDGVINRDSPDYVKSPDEWQPYPDSLEAISRLHRNHYRVIVATNQSGISRNLFDLTMLHRIHQKMITMVNEKGGQIDAVFFCPHQPEDLCSCRKPQPGLLLEAASRLGVSLAGVPFVGDKASDLAAANAVSALPILIQRTRPTGQQKAFHEGGLSYTHLAAFVDDLLAGVYEQRMAALANTPIIAAD